jgi:membrane protein required for colicin V production
VLNWFDIFMAIALIVAFASGFRQGLIRQLINFVGLIFAIVFAGQFAKIILPWFLQITKMPHNIVSVISYLSAFAIIMAIISLCGSVIHKLVTIVHLGFFNKLLGSVVSIGIAAVRFPFSIFDILRLKQFVLLFLCICCRDCLFPIQEFLKPVSDGDLK